MSVVDASVAADALVRREGLPPAARASLRGRIQVPSLFPAEVTSALRGLLLGGHISEPVAATARARLSSVRMRLHPFLPYADRVWALRADLTVYDAWYVAIAERLSEPLVTSDAAILDAPGLRARSSTLALRHQVARRPRNVGRSRTRRHRLSIPSLLVRRTR